MCKAHIKSIPYLYGQLFALLEKGGVCARSELTRASFLPIEVINVGVGRLKAQGLAGRRYWEIMQDMNVDNRPLPCRLNAKERAAFSLGCLREQIDNH